MINDKVSALSQTRPTMMKTTRTIYRPMGDMVCMKGGGKPLERGTTRACWRSRLGDYAWCEGTAGYCGLPLTTVLRTWKSLVRCYSMGYTK